MYLAGRGAGKTRSGAEFCKDVAARKITGRIALVGPTAADTRDVMVEGESGIMATASPNFMPEYEPSKRRVEWPNGVRATLYSADEPERLRGPQHGFAWCDEICSWRYGEDAWSNLMFGLRIGQQPRTFVSTTPKPMKLLKEILKDPGTVITRGSTYQNAANLAPTFLTKIISRYEGTRLGRQELLAEILEDNPDALWHLTNIDAMRVKGPALEVRQRLVRCVVAVDPPTTSGEDSDECGIVVCGIDEKRHGYTLADYSCQGKKPGEWAKIAVAAYHEFKCDRIVAEINQGGEMVEQVIRQVDDSVAYRGVHARHGKVMRAEPVAALYEKRRASHVGTFGALEDQMCSFTVGFDKKLMGYSPDRVDALVHAYTDLLISASDGIIQFYRNELTETKRKQGSRHG